MIINIIASLEWSGSSTKPSINLPTAPVDTNVPPSSDFKNADETGGNTKISKGFNVLMTNQPLVQKMEEKSTITYQIKENESWYGQSISGTLTVKLDSKYDNKYKSVYTFDGEIIIDGVKYTFENFVYSYEEQDGGVRPSETFTGIVKIDGSQIDNTEIANGSDVYTLINEVNHIASISTIQSGRCN